MDRSTELHSVPRVEPIPTSKCARPLSQRPTPRMHCAPVFGEHYGEESLETRGLEDERAGEQRKYMHDYLARAGLRAGWSGRTSWKTL